MDDKSVFFFMLFSGLGIVFLWVDYLADLRRKNTAEAALIRLRAARVPSILQQITRGGRDWL